MSKEFDRNNKIDNDKVRFPFKVEMVEQPKGRWGVRAVIQNMTVEEAHQFGETLADYFDEFNQLNPMAATQ